MTGKTLKWEMWEGSDNPVFEGLFAFRVLFFFPHHYLINLCGSLPLEVK